jgi:hypothetical protein
MNKEAPAERIIEDMRSATSVPTIDSPLSLAKRHLLMMHSKK